MQSPKEKDLSRLWRTWQEAYNLYLHSFFGLSAKPGLIIALEFPPLPRAKKQPQSTINVYSVLTKKHQLKSVVRDSLLQKTATLRMLSLSYLPKPESKQPASDPSHAIHNPSLLYELCEIRNLRDLQSVIARYKQMPGGGILQEMAKTDISHIRGPQFQNYDMSAKPDPHLDFFFQLFIELYLAAGGNLEGNSEKSRLIVLIALSHHKYSFAEKLFDQGVIVHAEDINNLDKSSIAINKSPTAILWLALHTNELPVEERVAVALPGMEEESPWKLFIESALKKGAVLHSKGLVGSGEWMGNLLMGAVFALNTEATKVLKKYFSLYEKDERGYTVFYHAINQYCGIPSEEYGMNWECLEALVYHDRPGDLINPSFKINAIIDYVSNNTLIHGLIALLDVYYSKTDQFDEAFDEVIISLFKDLLIKCDDFDYHKKNKKGESALEMLESLKEQYPSNTPIIDLKKFMEDCMQKQLDRRAKQTVDARSGITAGKIGLMSKKRDREGEDTANPTAKRTPLSPKK